MLFSAHHSKMFTLALLLLVPLFSPACTRPQQELPKRSLSTNSAPSLTSVTAAIQRAGSVQGWETRVVQPGTIEAKKEWDGGKHNIVVHVLYNTSEYEIKHVSTKNLSAGDGVIHNTYNRFTARLYDEIHTQMSKAP